MGLAKLMDYKSAAKLWFKPCSLWRHDVARVRYVHYLLHSDWIESESSLHLSAVHSALEFGKPSKTSHKVYAMVAAKVFDAEYLIKNEL